VITKVASNKRRGDTINMADTNDGDESVSALVNELSLIADELEGQNARSLRQ
jgi:hypothetical protein